MKAIFVHDHPFCIDPKENVYTSGSLNTNLWDRYIKCFQTLTVVCRGKKFTGKIDGLVESSHPQVKFDLIYEVSGGLDYITKSETIKKRLIKAISETDAVIVRLPSAFGGYCADICKKMGKPYIAEVVGCAWDANWNFGNLIGKLYAPYAFYKTKRAVRNSIASIYVTEKFLQKRYPNSGKLTSFASNVKINNFSPTVLTNHIDLLKKESKTLQLGLIGNLQVKYKGYDTAMKALAIVKQKTSHNFKLNLIGGGNPTYVQQLTEKYNLEAQVNILGLLKSGQQVFDRLDVLDLYIHPSKQEGLPRSVIEAMGRGCPVLASSVAGIPELLGEEYLHQPGDYRTLAKQIISVLTDTSKLVEMSQTNFSKSKEYIDEILSEKRDKFWKEASYLIKKDSK